MAGDRSRGLGANGAIGRPAPAAQRATSTMEECQSNSSAGCPADEIGLCLVKSETGRDRADLLRRVRVAEPHFQAPRRVHLAAHRFELPHAIEDLGGSLEILDRFE